MKYIICKCGCLYIPIILPDHSAHAHFLPNDKDIKIDSAGFCAFKDGEIVIFPDKSESLDIGPKMARDQTLLTLLLSGYGMPWFLDHSMFD